MAGIRRKQPEQEFHKTVARFLNAALPPSCWWTTFPAGGGGKARGGKLKAMGLKPGVADILILYRRPFEAMLADRWAVRVLWLELKTPKGRLSDGQEAFTEKMGEFIGVAVEVCRSLDDVQGALEHAGINLNARVVTGRGSWVREAA